MNKKYIKIILFIFITLLCVTGVFSVLHDKPTEILLKERIYNNLSDAIADADVSDVIYVGGDINVDHTIIITKDITIKPLSNAAITSSELVSPMFNVMSGSKLSIQGEKGKTIKLTHLNQNSICINLERNGNLSINQYVYIQSFDKYGTNYVITINAENKQELNLGKYTEKDVYKTRLSSDVELSKEDINEQKQECKINTKIYENMSEAIEDAKDGDTITLLSDIYLRNTLIIDKNIEITGDYNIYMLGSSANPTFLINDATLTLDQEQFTINGSNGNAAIIINGGSLVCHNLTINGNYIYSIITDDMTAIKGNGKDLNIKIQ